MMYYKHPNKGLIPCDIIGKNSNRIKVRFKEEDGTLGYDTIDINTIVKDKKEKGTFNNPKIKKIGPEDSSIINSFNI